MGVFVAIIDTKPYDLNEIGKKNLINKFRRGYKPKVKPYDLNSVYEQKLYHEWKK